MPDTPTPGQVAYAAYCTLLRPYGWYSIDYGRLLPLVREAWEAAAQAVIAGADRQQALACSVQQAVWTQIACCDCDTAGRVPVGELCASCESLRSIADAAQAVLPQALAPRVGERQAPSPRWQEVPPTGAPPDEPSPAEP